MSGVIVAMRRTLLSCTSLARNGLIALGATQVSIVPARASDLALLDAISIFFDFNRQEIAALTTAPKPPRSGEDWTAFCAAVAELRHSE